MQPTRASLINLVDCGRCITVICFLQVPAFLNVVDIAGLVKGAAEGAGLGNAFLSNISSCDAIFHMTRAFDDKEVVYFYTRNYKIYNFFPVIRIKHFSKRTLRIIFNTFQLFFNCKNQLFTKFFYI